MRLRAETVMRLAFLTRRFSRIERPVGSWFSRSLLELIYPPGAAAKDGHRFVVPYDAGVIAVDTATWSGYEVLFHQSLHPEMVRAIKAVVKPGSVCLDVGANVGCLTLIMSFCAGPTGRVIAVEPQPRVAAQLRENIALNNLPNVQVIEAALCDTDGKVQFYTFPEGEFNQGISGLSGSDRATRAIEVRALSGRKFQEELNLSTCDLIKIDVQGHERTVLTQLGDLVRRARPYIIFECWEEAGSDPGETCRMLLEQGYKLWYLKHELIRPLDGPPPKRCDIFCVPAGRAAPA